MRIERSKLPKGMSYPLKSSALELALRSAAIGIETHLVQRVDGQLFEAFFWPTAGNVDHERLFIRASAVQSPDAGRAREFLNTQVIPEFVAWARGITALPTNSTIRREEQYFLRQLP